MLKVADALTGIARRARTPARIVAYVPASLATSSFSLDADTVAAVVDAENAIRHAQRYADTAGVSTIAQQLLRSEAIVSSRMEGIDVPSHRSVAKAIAGEQYRPSAQAAIANIDAVKWIYERAADGQPLTLQGSRDIHTRLAQADRHISERAGMIRTRQNWIQQITGASEAATLRALNHLAAAGVLAQVTVGRRNRQWEPVGLFALVDDMERRVSSGQRGAADTR